MAVGNTRTNEVGRERSMDSRIQNVPVTVAAEIRNAAEPALGVISDRRAAAVQVETTHSRCAGVQTQVRIPSENIDFWRVLRMGRCAEKRKNSQ